MTAQYTLRLTGEERLLFKQMVLHELESAKNLTEKAPHWDTVEQIPKLNLLLDKIEHAEVRMK